MAIPGSPLRRERQKGHASRRPTRRSQLAASDWSPGELAGLDREARLATLNELGDQAAEHLRLLLAQALDTFRHLLVLLHVPPFRAACWHEGHISTDDYLPHFACKAVGEVLVEAMQARPARTMTVLCGHTHSAGEVRILPNLLVKTGGAVYGRPQIQELIAVE